MLRGGRKADQGAEIAYRNTAITPNGRTAYVTNASSDMVTPIRTATNTAGKAASVGSDPSAIAITP
jgi:YVTN family beta-propeller protein